MRNIFFDLDGTLLNSLERLYILFRELSPECEISFDDYWKIKRQKVTQEQFLTKYLNYTSKKVDEFRIRWMEMVESEKLLSLDAPFESSFKLLESLSVSNHLYIVTARQDECKVKNQIANFGWNGFLKRILVTKQKQKKSEIIKQNVFNISSDDVIVGDTGEDVIAGKELGIKTVAVTSGFLNAESLSYYKPTIIVEGVDEIYQKNLLNDLS